MMVDAGKLSRVEAPAVTARPMHASYLDFGAGMRLRVSFEDARAAAFFGKRYHHMIASRQDVSFAIDVVPDRDGTQLFRVTPGATYAWQRGPIGAEDVAFLADAVATTTAFTRMTGTLTLHAAAIRSASGAFAIVGDSNTGKTTTAVACGLSGFEVYSDEFCIVSNGSVRPFPRSLSLRPGGMAVLHRLTALPATLREALRLHEGGWSGVRFDDIFDGVPADERAPLRAIFLLDGRADHPSIEPLTPAALLPAAARYAKSAKPGLERITDVLLLLRSLSCYKLVVGDPNETVRAIAQVVARNAIPA